MFDAKKIVLAKLEEMVSEWNKGNAQAAQKCYEYLLGFCESQNADFCKTFNSGLHILMSRCVGIKDTMQYVNYINCVVPEKD